MFIKTYLRRQSPKKALRCLKPTCYAKLKTLTVVSYAKPVSLRVPPKSVANLQKVQNKNQIWRRED